MIARYDRTLLIYWCELISSVAFRCLLLVLIFGQLPLTKRARFVRASNSEVSSTHIRWPSKNLCLTCDFHFFVYEYRVLKHPRIIASSLAKNRTSYFRLWSLSGFKKNFKYFPSASELMMCFLLGNCQQTIWIIPSELDVLMIVPGS